MSADGAWYDIPGPEVLSAREILLRVAALRGRKVPNLRVPFLTVSLSSWWLKLVTQADFAVARELVLGLEHDLLPESRAYWKKVGFEPRTTFEQSVERALANETDIGISARLEEAIVQWVAPKVVPVFRVGG